MKILMISPNFNKVCGRSRMVYNLIKGFQEKGNECELMTNGGDAMNKLEHMNVKIHIEDINPDAKSMMGFLKARSKLADMTRRGEYQIVHVHHRYYDLLVSSVTTPSFRSVHSVHSYLAGKRSFGFNADVIVPVSLFIKEHLINDHNVKPEKISTIYNFIDTSDYDTKLSPEKENDERVL